MEEEREGVYTADRLRERTPRTFAAVVKMLAEGYGIQRIARLTGTSEHTVLAVRDNFLAEVAHARAQDIRRLSATRRRVQDRIDEKLEDPIQVANTSLKDLGWVMDKLIDKELLLGGEATSRLEVVDSRSLHSLNDFVDAIVVDSMPIPSPAALIAGEDQTPTQ
jgi:hypothetical protein